MAAVAVLLGLLLAAASVSSVSAQTTAKADSVASPADRLRVFLDCDECDFDFIRTEVSFVDYVRNRQDAQVHILATSQVTGGGGREYTLTFIGQRELATLTDTLRHVSPQAASEDDLRRALARIIKLGLVRYATRIGQAASFDVTYTAASPAGGAKGAASGRDRWNFWVFRTSASGFGRGEKTSNFLSLNGSVSANRTTEAWKMSLALNGNYGQSRFDLGDGTRYNSYSHSYGVNNLLVKSLGPHWSAGQRASWTSSTFLNQQRAIRFAPAVEYNFFPYAQSTRRQLTLRYGPGISYFRYQDTTIFDRISEVRGDQTLTVSLDLKQPWGSVSSSLEGAAYLHDPSKQHLIFFNSLDLRLFKGLSLFFFGQGSIIRDQLYLRRGNLSDTERLLRLRQLATSYSYFANVGLSYSFGSIFNNIVNSRFGGSSGGFMFFN